MERYKFQKVQNLWQVKKKSRLSKETVGFAANWQEENWLPVTANPQWSWIHDFDLAINVQGKWMRSTTNWLWTFARGRGQDLPWTGNEPLPGTVDKIDSVWSWTLNGTTATEWLTTIWQCTNSGDSGEDWRCLIVNVKWHHSHGMTDHDLAVYL